jgi:ABC-type lipoprotein export system ATPase subunit
MIEVLHRQLEPTRYVVINKDKIVIVTHDKKYAEYLARVIEENDFDRSYSLVVG